MAEQALLAINAEDNRFELLEYIEDKKTAHPELKWTVEDVLAVYEQGHEIPATQYDFVFLELGYQKFKPDGTPAIGKKSGSGWQHILEIHSDHFASHGIVKLFSHLRNCLLYGQREVQDKLNYYLLRVNGKVVPTVIHIGGNGYFGTAFPCSKLRLNALDLSKLREIQTEEILGPEEDQASGNVLDSTSDITVLDFWAAIKVNGEYVDVNSLARTIPTEVLQLLEQIEDQYRLYETDPELFLPQAEFILQDLRCLRLAYLLRKLTKRRVFVILSIADSSKPIEANTHNLRVYQALLLKGLAREVLKDGDSAVEIELLEVNLKQYRPDCSNLRFEVLPSSSPRKQADIPH